MIVIDFNQVVIANFFASVGNHTNTEITLESMRELALNSIRHSSKKFKKVYGDVVLACDSRKSWRKEFFPYYKASRRDKRSESDVDWRSLYDSLDTIKLEIKDNVPARLVEVEGAEADDIIAILCEKVQDQDIVIVSADKDFKQLQRFDRVDQYDPIRAKWVTEDNPEAFLHEHILKGDIGDGIPNVLCHDDHYVAKGRRRMVTEKVKERLSDPSYIADEMERRNYHRNKTLIDFSCIPEDLKSQIWKEINNVRPATKSDLKRYFMKHRLREFVDLIEDF